MAISIFLLHGPLLSLGKQIFSVLLWLFKRDILCRVPNVNIGTSVTFSKYTRYNIYLESYKISVITLSLFFTVSAALFEAQGKHEFETWRSVLSGTSTVFSVRSCSDVHVALSQYTGIALFNAYEVVIGSLGNT